MTARDRLIEREALRHELVREMRETTKQRDQERRHARAEKLARMLEVVGRAHSRSPYQS